jgi:hypothetical protein
LDEVVRGGIPTTHVLEGANAQDQLEVLHTKLLTERTEAIKALIKCALTQPDPSRVMITAKEKYERCKIAINFTEFLIDALPGWEKIEALKK